MKRGSNSRTGRKRLKGLFMLIFLLLSLFGCDKQGRETFDVPDPNFSEALLDLGVDRNGDGLFSYSEAERIRVLDLQPLGIQSLSGIEAFINLDTLRIIMNPLGQLDLSSNLSLRFLECSGCELKSLNVTGNKDLRYLDCSGTLAMGSSLNMLDLSQNLLLEYLDCSENDLGALDVKINTELEFLSCSYNSLPDLDVSQNLRLSTLLCNNNAIAAIDVSANAALIRLITCGNKLKKLDISKNTSLQKVGFDNMLTLTEVCVWTLPFPPEGLIVLAGFSPYVEYVMDCDSQ